MFDSLGSSQSSFECSPIASFRHPDSWAAYGRFIATSVHKGQAHNVHFSADGALRHFRYRTLRLDASLLFAYQDCQSRSDSIWSTASRALRTISSRERVDHLNVFVAGEVHPEDASGRVVRTDLEDEYMGLAFPYSTRDIFEFPDGFESFLSGLGRSNRRHLKARQKKAMDLGLRFELNDQYESISRKERYALGLRSHPMPYAKQVLDAWDGYALAQPGFFQCNFRDPKGTLLSYSTGFFEHDTAVMMYQLNAANEAEFGLSMAFRGCLIEHCAARGIKRLVLPMGVAGNLSHATSTNPIARVLFVRRSLPAVAKALLLRVFVPTSYAAQMVATRRFHTLISGRENALGG
jgi:hypothetical protein